MQLAPVAAGDGVARHDPRALADALVQLLAGADGPPGVLAGAVASDAAQGRT